MNIDWKPKTVRAQIDLPTVTRARRWLLWSSAIPYFIGLLSAIVAARPLFGLWLPDVIRGLLSTPSFVGGWAFLSVLLWAAFCAAVGNTLGFLLWLWLYKRALALPAEQVVEVADPESSGWPSRQVFRRLYGA